MKLKSIVLLIALMVISLGIAAQPGPNVNPNEDPDKVPISGIEILIGLGGALGIRKLMSTKGNKSSEK